MKLNSQKNQIAVKSQLWTWQITELFSGGNTFIKDFYFIWNIYSTQEMGFGERDGGRGC